MVSVWFWDGLEIVEWFGDGLGVVGGWLGLAWGRFGAGLKLVWGWFGGVVGGQRDGEIWVTIRDGLATGQPWGPGAQPGKPGSQANRPRLAQRGQVVSKWPDVTALLAA